MLQSAVSSWLLFKQSRRGVQTYSSLPFNQWILLTKWAVISKSPLYIFPSIRYFLWGWSRNLSSYGIRNITLNKSHPFMSYYKPIQPSTHLLLRLILIIYSFIHFADNLMVCSGLNPSFSGSTHTPSVLRVMLQIYLGIGSSSVVSVCASHCCLYSVICYSYRTVLLLIWSSLIHPYSTRRNVSFEACR